MGEIETERERKRERGGRRERERGERGGDYEPNFLLLEAVVEAVADIPSTGAVSAQLCMWRGRGPFVLIAIGCPTFENVLANQQRPRRRVTTTRCRSVESCVVDVEVEVEVDADAVVLH